RLERAEQGAEDAVDPLRQALDPEAIEDLRARQVEPAEDQRERDGRADEVRVVGRDVGRDPARDPADRISEVGAAEEGDCDEQEADHAPDEPAAESGERERPDEPDQDDVHQPLSNPASGLRRRRYNPAAEPCAGRSATMPAMPTAGRSIPTYVLRR